jgi:very-short-patch-repair endonuclease
VHVHGYRVDFYHPEHNLIVEVDGYDAHSDPRQFAEDRRRDREILIATGIVTIRFTYDDCIDAPAGVAGTVRGAIARTS